MMRILLVLIFLTVSLGHAALELKIDDLGETMGGWNDKGGGCQVLRYLDPHTAVGSPSLGPFRSAVFLFLSGLII